MGFQQKEDYCGLTATAALSTYVQLKEVSENVSIEKYQPQGQDGSFIAMETFGEDSAPSCTYAVVGNITATAGQIKLNTVSTRSGSTKKYALESLTITTSAGAAPTISATSQEVESTATDASQCHYDVPAFSLTTKHHAQILFSAFTLSGEGCALTECSATVSGTINKDKVAGVKVSSDINSGAVVVTGTILQTGSATPTLTADTQNGWTITGPLNCTNPETAYKSYSFEVTKNLAKSAVTSGGGSGN